MTMKDKHIIITGGAGFIGSSLVAGLECCGYRHISIVDNLGTGEKWRNLSHRVNGLKVYPIGSTIDLIGSLGDKVGAVVHLGAISATTASDADNLNRLNTLDTCDIAAECRHRDIPMLYASSASVYGDGHQGMDEKCALLATPLNPYAWSKLNADRLIFGDSIDSDDAIVALRFFNVYGPNEYHKGSQSSVIPHFFDQLTHTGSISLFKSGRNDIPDGWQSRDFVWIDDCVDIMLQFISKGCRPGGIYNVGTGISRTFLDMASAVADAAGIDAKIEYIPMPADLSRHYQYHTCSAGDRLTSRANLSLSFTPLESGVNTYITKYLTQPDKYR